MTTDNEAVLQQTLYSLLVRMGSQGLKNNILSFIQTPLFLQPNNHYLQIKELDNNMVAVAIIELSQEEGSDIASEVKAPSPSSSDTGGSAQETEDSQVDVPEASKSPAPQTISDEPKSRAEKGD